MCTYFGATWGVGMRGPVSARAASRSHFTASYSAAAAYSSVYWNRHILLVTLCLRLIILLLECTLAIL
ncbi:hypothetical protein O3P69_016065 [Scylla paramamosain]|uniref:Uncharacterized protein n=1 Tax=Scylla paramamosain TaxID=85552 RepID=A0AAW0TA58_SCYPA